MLPKKKIKTGLDDILKAVTETHRRGYNQPPTGYNQVNQPQPQGGELQMGAVNSLEDDPLFPLDQYGSMGAPPPEAAAVQPSHGGTPCRMVITWRSDPTYRRSDHIHPKTRGLDRDSSFA